MSMNYQTDSLPDHSAAMDRMYRFQRHIYDATRHYYLLSRDLLLDGLAPSPGGSVLEIGCGTGRNLIRAAKRYPDAKLFGIDISQEMLKTALRTMDAMSVSQRVKVACADATSFNAELSLGQSKFDRIYFSYTLSMIPEWQTALHHTFTLLSETGELHIVDFGQCERLPKFFRNSLFQWLNMFHVTPRAMLKTELESLTVESESDVQLKLCHRGYAWLAVVKPKVCFNAANP
jgi:S-adenosylmethionine-diacylgycerolhomoserine-N-methlytransferase